jgi:hypothetical protein
MDPTECQKQIERLSNQIRTLEAQTKKTHIRGVPFTETARLEFFEFLREQTEKKCRSI